MKKRLVVFGIAFSILINFGLAWFLVSINAQRAGLGYKLSENQQTIIDLQALNAKLKVERDRLYSPSRLELKAADMGLHSARPGQKRIEPEG